MKLLGYASVPAYAHVPLVVAPDGERLAKRAGGLTVRELAARGFSPETILGTLARARPRRALRQRGLRWAPLRAGDRRAARAAGALAEDAVAAPGCVQPAGVNVP